MIKFFRKIRYNLLSEKRTGKYLKYALGEIVLVMIGILLALQVNNWNELKKQSNNELQLLNKLKNDISKDINRLKWLDSLYTINEANGKLGIELFYKAQTVKEIDSVNSLTSGQWHDLQINNSTYNEMLSNGSLYTMKNKELQGLITEFYLRVEIDRGHVSQINNGQIQMIYHNPGLYKNFFLRNQIRTQQVPLNLIDTSWINDPNSPTYLAMSRYLEANQTLNHNWRRSMHVRTLSKANELLNNITNELQSRGND
jgi:hypothetical protein